jgi:transcriptional antiterminator RfaH
MPEWYVLKTKPQAERQVSALLEMRAAEHYLPTVRSARNHSRTEPLFPGYLFCRVKIPSVQWVEVRSLPGISYVLNAQGTPLPVPETLVDSIRARAEAEAKGPRPCRFVSGERVEIVRGPFQGLEAAFDRRLSPSGRSRVFVNLLSRLVPVEIPEAELVKAG